MDILNNHSITVYLETPVEILYERLQHEVAQRPLLQGKSDLRKFIKELLAQREKFYRQAQFTIHTAGKTVEEIAAEIAAVSG
jgi:shikimate kinase